MHTVLGRQRAGFNLEFLQRVGERRRHVAAAGELVVEGAIEDIRKALAQSSGDRNHDVPLEILRGLIGNGRCCRTVQLDKVGNLTAVQGEFEDALIFHDGPHALTSGFDECSVCLYFNLFADLPDFQDGIDDLIRIHLQDDSDLKKCSKPGQCGLEFVRANREVRQDEVACFICNDIPDDTRVGLCRGNLDAGQNRSALISNRAADLGGCLSPDCSATKSNK